MTLAECDVNVLAGGEWKGISMSAQPLTLRQLLAAAGVSAGAVLLGVVSRIYRSYPHQRRISRLPCLARSKPAV